MAVSEWFGARLRELREAQRLTQRELAQQAGVSMDGLAQWERGVREPGWSNVLALAAALGVDCTAFTEAPTPQDKPGPGRPLKAKPAAAAGKGKRAKGKGKPRK